MRAVVAPRVAAKDKTGCDCCGRYRRCAVIWIDYVGVEVRRTLDLCSGCCKAAWDAAKKSVRA